MDKKDQQTMDAHGITVESRNIYCYRNFRYDRLDDAVRYAEIDARRDQKVKVNS